MRRLTIVGVTVTVIAAIALGTPVVVEWVKRSDPRKQPLIEVQEKGRLGGGPRIDIHKEGPLGGGRKVALDDAIRATPYSLPIPSTTEDTGGLSGIWMTQGGCEGSECSSPQVGFLWATDITFYVNEVPADLIQEQVVAAWKKKVSNGDRVLLSIRGLTAIGHQRDETGPSSLTWMEQGLGLQFVSPSHTLLELESFAGAIRFEE